MIRPLFVELLMIYIFKIQIKLIKLKNEKNNMQRDMKKEIVLNKV